MTNTSNSTKPAKKLWPPIHEVTYTNGDTRWQVRYQLNGKRTNEVFQTKAEAVAAAAQIRLKIANEGAAGFNLPREVQVEAAAAVETLTPYEGETIAKAVEFYVAHCLRFRNAPTAGEIIKEFIGRTQRLAEPLLHRPHQIARGRLTGSDRLIKVAVSETGAELRKLDARQRGKFSHPQNAQGRGTVFFEEFAQCLQIILGLGECRDLDDGAVVGGFLDYLLEFGQRRRLFKIMIGNNERFLVLHRQR